MRGQRFWPGTAMALFVLATCVTSAPSAQELVRADTTTTLQSGAVDELGAATAPAKTILLLPVDIEIPIDVTAFGLRLAEDIAPFAAATGLTGTAGALVLSVRRGSDAEAAGLQPGDLVAMMGGREIGSAAELEAALLLRADISMPAELRIIRFGQGSSDFLDVLRRSAEGGNRNALMALGDASLLGFAGTQDAAEAEGYYLAANAMGDARAALRLGTMYLEGRGVDIDLAVATRWFRTAADAGLPAGRHALALTWWNGRYWTGQALVGDREEAVRLFTLAAAQGHIESHLYLGYAYHHGWGVPADRTVAGAWYDSAIAAGNTDAMYQRAEMLLAEAPTDPIGAQAVDLLHQAAAGGHPDANRRLGTMYREGNGVPLSPFRSLAYFRAAAKAGDRQSMISLAEILTVGYGVVRNEDEGLDWYFRAYQAGDAEAGYALAYAYADGLGVERDLSKVAGFLLEAIRRGSRRALEEMKSNAETWELEVREDLQELLLAGGHYSGAIDGVFGPGTLRALDAAARSGSES